ncbi:MAG: hypothetical protein EHM36_08960 [Deltaproteobacteria bacterium]|nr:MAG: hypothetical protein EHM36_08960 [Deltaproteobacteria bacterium]
MEIENGGYYVEDRRLSDDRERYSAYIEITAWDPDNKVLQATLFGRDDEDREDKEDRDDREDRERREGSEGREDREDRDSWSVPLSLQYISGTNLDFLCSSQITLDNGANYGFTARIRGWMRRGVLVGGSFRTAGGYHVQSVQSQGERPGNQDVSGWLKIIGRMVPEGKVPGDFLK